MQSDKSKDLRMRNEKENYKDKHYMLEFQKMNVLQFQHYSFPFSPIKLTNKRPVSN